MSNAILQGGASGTGNMTLLAPNTNSNRTVTFPDVDGQAMVSGAMPAFHAYTSASTTSLSSSTWTKVTLDAESYDTNNNFASSRFTPTVAGYYQINFQIYCSSTGNNAYWQWASIYKNGSSYISNNNVNASGQLQNFTWGVNQLIYMNGSSDYLEFYTNIYVASGTPQYYGGNGVTMVTGYLARTA